jgi:hypothetical protein
MNAQITPKDWQILSEYLDGQLSPRDRSKLEQRMQSRPELRDGLEELRRLRSLLRTVPRRKVPHNFTLTRAMVEKPAPARWSNWIPALSFSSAIATFLLILSMLTSMPGGVPAAVVSPESEASRVMMEEPAAETVQDAVEAPPLILWGGPGNYSGTVDGRGGMGGGGDAGMGSADFGLMAVPEAEVYVDEGMPLPEERMKDELPVEPPVMEAAPAEMPAEAPAAEAPAGEAPAMSAASEALAEEQLEPLVGTGPILGVAPVEEQGTMQLKSVPEEIVQQEDQQAEPEGSPWLILQIGLVLVAIATGASALYLRRKAKA